MICAVVLMSSSARITVASLALTLTPPIRSAAFSRLAIQRAAALVAPLWLSANTDAPRACGVMKASAWIETNRSACTRARLAHALVQRHEEVGVARQHRAHVRQRVDAVAQLQRDRQHHVLLVQAARPDRARVLAAVAGVDRDDDQAVDLAARSGAAAAASVRGGAGSVPARRRGGVARRRAAGALALGTADLADELAERVLHRLRGLLLGLLLAAISASSGSRSCVG